MNKLTMPWLDEKMIRKAFCWIAYLAVILYNNWVLALFLNSRAFYAGATTSELGVAGQPYFLLFRVLDIASGFCFLLTFMVISNLTKHQIMRCLLQLLMLSMGIATILESLVFPLTCSSALSATCAQQEMTSRVGWSHQVHLLESVASYILIFLLPLIVMFVVRHNRHSRRLLNVSRILVIFMVIWVIESTYRLDHHASRFGYEQRAFILLFTYWYYLALKAARSAFPYSPHEDTAKIM